MEKTVKDKVLLLPIVLLGIHFLMRVFDFAKIMFSYPLYSEAVTELAQLFFLKVCGFHAECPYWYNGLTTFLVTPPMWYFFAYPFYIVSGNILIGAYTSLIVTYIIAFLGIYGIGSLIGLTPLKRVLFFLLVFGNNVLIKMMAFGRFHEIFAWSLFSMTFLLLIYYKDKKIDKKSVLISLGAALTILAHQSIGILIIVVFVGFLLTKKGEEFRKAVGLFLLSIIGSSWWLVPAFFEAQKNLIAKKGFLGVEGWWSFPLGTFNFTRLALILLPILTIGMFYRYYSRNKKSREILFFMPGLVIIALLFFGLLPFIPIMNNIFTNMYLEFVYIFLAFFALKTYSWEEKYKKIYIIGLVVAASAMILVNVLGVSWFQGPTAVENNIVEIGKGIESHYIFLGSFPSTSFPPAYYGYFAIYSNLTTPGGWAPHIRDEGYLDKLWLFKKNEFTCEELEEWIKYFGIKYVLAYDERCDKLDRCDLVLEKKKEKACLYKTP